MRAFSAIALATLTLIGAACAKDSPVGDLCIPETLPEGGTHADEVLIEKESVQCATRICMVRGLEGDPRKVAGTASCSAGDESCISQDVASRLEKFSFCTCRCEAAPGSTAPTCNCPGSFKCESVLESGEEGLRGSYCVPKSTD